MMLRHPSLPYSLAVLSLSWLVACGNVGDDPAESADPSQEDGADKPLSSDTELSGAAGSHGGSGCPIGTEGDDCTPCPSGTFDHDADAATECTPWSDCAPGSYVTATGTSSSDRSCKACSPGTFSAEANAESCEMWSVCAPGTYVDSSGMSSADRVCAACEDGSFSSLENAASCTPWTDCEPGTYVASEPSDIEDRACAPCEDGTTSTATNASECL